jgi:hypothetical protein
MTTDYGIDIHTPGAMDLDPAFSLVSGLQGLGEALARRFVTARGSLPGDAAYGHDLRAYLNHENPPLHTIEAAAVEQMELDERVSSAVARATFAADILAITATGVARGIGPFRLVLEISAVTVALLDAETT